MSFFYKEKDNYGAEDVKAVNVAISGIAGFLVLMFLWLIIGPTYRVWSQGMEGKAELRRAEQNRQIQIVQAEANNIAATSNAEAQIKIATAQATAEIERAKGAAKANEIISDSLKGNESYLRYLWIDKLSDKSVIYVPTEAGLPILEAGKR